MANVKDSLGCLALTGAITIFVVYFAVFAGDSSEERLEKIREEDRIYLAEKYKTQPASAAKSEQPAEEKPAEETPISDLKWKEVNEVYALGSKATDLQKEELWKPYKGKRVRWTGKVASIDNGYGGLVMCVKMNKDTFTSDVRVTLLPTQKSAALRYSEGDSVTFVATLDDWGTLLAITADDGVIE
jgi:hypothetical protein